MNPPPPLTSLRAAALLWLGLLAGFAAGGEWIRTRPPAPPAPSGRIDLVGTGATFPFPLHRRWFAENQDRTGIRINHFSVGSGEGIRLLFDGEADFGATDHPLRPEELARARCGPLVVPTAVGAITGVHDLPRVASTVHLDADALTEYLATSTQWHADGASGTTGPPPLPAGEVLVGNEGVAALVRAREGAIRLVELAYAQQARLDVAALTRLDAVVPGTCPPRRT